MNFNSLNKSSVTLIKSIDHQSEPVGVKFLEQVPKNDYKVAINNRFCQLIMRARKGEELILTPEGITCPASAAAIGFKPLPQNLQDGTMLQGFGIFKKKESAINVMECMTRLEYGKYKAVLAKPLKSFEELPDVIIIEDEVEKLMWIALAYLNDKGERLNFSTSILQAICVDSAVIQFVTNDINMSFGCYGYRDSTDAKSGEAILGFPGNKLEMVIKNLESLKSKAIDRSRQKLVYNSFKNRLGVS